MTERQYREIIKHRALFAKEKADILNNPGIKEASEKVLEFLKSKDFDVHDLINMEAYKIVLRTWFN